PIRVHRVGPPPTLTGAGSGPSSCHSILARTRTTRPTRPPASRNFHLPLPEDLHEALARAAHERGRPATEVARAAIREWLAARRREAVSGEIATYARAVAGSAADLDEALERSAVEHLRGRPRRGRRA